ncbi:MAG TPA: glycosyltransferase [Gammaproteobacteria bacterium]|nr:glycosyltransferase [Gammaproteobacteria bacterium]
MRANAPAVSVVLPAYDAAGTIARAVRSVLAQTFRDFELVVVDDGSTDATAAEVRRAAAGDARVRLVALEHRGIVPALNAGIAAARGRLIARMDADDEMLPRRLEAQVALLAARPDVGVASCLVEFGGDARAAQGYALHVDWLNGLREPDEIALSRFVESPIAHPSVTFRRELAERHGGYADGPEPEDYELWLRWMHAGVRFAKVPEVLLRWNDPPGRLSRTSSRYAVDAFYACKSRYLARWLRARLNEEREVWLWGAGRATRRRFAGLEREGVRVAGFIDIDARKVGQTIAGRAVRSPEQLPSPETAFVIGGVGVRGARELIRASLETRGFRMGEDFVLAA